MAAKKKSPKKVMTVRMLEYELRKLRSGFTEVIRVLQEIDGREAVTTISDGNIVPGTEKPWACPVVGWDCDGKVWRLKPAPNMHMTAPVRKSISLMLNGVTPCLGRLARYVDKYTKV